MAEAKKSVDVNKPSDHIIKTKRVPKARMFVLTDETNTTYEELLAKIEEGIVGGKGIEVFDSSGNWNNGEYRVQVHYYEITQTKELRKDTDFITSTDAAIAEKESKKKEVKKTAKKSESTKVVIRKDVVDFEGIDDRNKKNKPDEESEEVKEPKRKG